MKLLHIDTSIMSDQSVTRDLTAEIVSKHKSQQLDTEVIHYDLDSNPFSFLSSTSFVDEKELAISEKAVNDFLESDFLVIGAPMYNFSIPAQLKAWVDRIAVAGKTFQYTENGPVGLTKGKSVVIVSARGGVYSGNLSYLDHQESYLKNIFIFLGFEENDIEIIRAEGVNISPEDASEAIANAKSKIPSLKLLQRTSHD